MEEKEKSEEWQFTAEIGKKYYRLRRLVIIYLCLRAASHVASFLQGV